MGAGCSNASQAEVPATAKPVHATPADTIKKNPVPANSVPTISGDAGKIFEVGTVQGATAVHADGNSVAVYSFETYDDQHLGPALRSHVGEKNVKLLPVRLSAETAPLAAGYDARSCAIACSIPIYFPVQEVYWPGLPSFK